MSMLDVPNSKVLKTFVKGSFVLVGLIFVLSYGVAALLLHFDRNIEINNSHEINKYIENEKIETKKIVDIDKRTEISKNLECKVFALILVLICLPIIIFILVFIKFSCSVKSYYENLYGKLTDEGFILRMRRFEMEKQDIQEIKTLINSCLAEIKAIKHDQDQILDALLKNYKKKSLIYSKNGKVKIRKVKN